MGEVDESRIVDSGIGDRGRGLQHHLGRVEQLEAFFRRQLVEARQRAPGSRQRLADKPGAAAVDLEQSPGAGWCRLCEREATIAGGVVQVGVVIDAADQSSGIHGVHRSQRGGRGSIPWLVLLIGPLVPFVDPTDAKARRRP